MADNEIDDLKRKLAARKGKANWAENVREIEARIAELEQESTPSENNSI